MKVIAKPVKEVAFPAEQLAIAAGVAVLVLLASLHFLSPEFDPAWRMVSEYANGRYGWVLSLMFIAWGVSSWALAVAIWSQIRTRAGKIGLFFLILAGIGEAMASVFDINQPLHDVAALIGIPSLPIAAMLISVSLGRNLEWSKAKKTILWIANLTWISILLLLATFAIFMTTYMQAGGDTTTGVAPVVLPAGTIGLVGWANRFLVVVYCLWVITVAQQAFKLRKQQS